MEKTAELPQLHSYSSLDKVVDMPVVCNDRCRGGAAHRSCGRPCDHAATFRFDSGSATVFSSSPEWWTFHFATKVGTRLSAGAGYGGGEGRRRLDFVDINTVPSWPRLKQQQQQQQNNKNNRTTRTTTNTTFPHMMGYRQRSLINTSSAPQPPPPQPPHSPEG